MRLLSEQTSVFVSLPCLQFLSGILQAIKTRDKGRLGIAAAVLVMAKQTWLHLHLLLSHYPHSTPQMRSTGIPELTCVEDTDYIRNALVLDKNEDEAEHLFRKVTKKCLDLKWTVQVMWKIHLLRRSWERRCVLNCLHRYIGLCVSVHNCMWLYTHVFVKLWLTHYICICKQCYVVFNSCFLLCKCRMFVLLESNTFPFLSYVS